MKVLLLSAGVSIHTARWANGLSDAGVSVSLVTQHPVRQAFDPAVEVIEFPYRGNPGYFLMASKLRRIVRDIEPDLVNAHFASGYGTTGMLLDRHPYVLSVWGSDVFSFPERSILHRKLVTKNLKAADVVASTSHCMADRVRTLLRDVGDIPITPFGIDIESFASVPGLPAGETGPLVIGTVKSMEDVYGIDTLIDAFGLLTSQLRERDHPLRDQVSLRLVGGGSRLDSLKARADGLGLGHRVTFVGPVPHADVPAEMAKLDIYVALSRQESFGVAVLEAGAAGRPVVVSDAGGLAEVVRHGETGLVVPREDPGAAAAALLALVDDPARRHRLGEAGQSHVGDKYAWEQCVPRMLAVYEDALRISRP